jgi:xylulose-5-phosphate/fructose-6-phosphate phosphoketolase
MATALTDTERPLIDACWRAAYAKQAIRDKVIEHKGYICKHWDNMPEIAGCTWSGVNGGRARSTEGDNV